MYELGADVYEQVHEAKDYRVEARALTTAIRHWSPGARTLLDVEIGRAHV